MNEEEKKAIEKIKGLETLFEIDDKKDFEATPLVQKEIAKDLKILLNLIDKMKNCINILDNELKERNKTINEKEIIIEKLQKENEELKKQVEYDKTHIYTPRTIELNYVSKQKIKDKIEELKINLVNMQGEELLIYESKIDVLQELLEGRK